MIRRIIFLLLLVTTGRVLARPQLAGDWQLDAKASDPFTDLHKQIGKFDRTHHREQISAHDDHHARGIAFVGPPPFITGIDLKSLPALASTTVTIRTQGKVVRFDFDHGHRRTVNPERKTTSISLSQYGRERDPAVQFSVWEDSQLVVETTRDSGLRVVGCWSVDGDGHLQARFTLHPPGLARPIHYHRVFVRTAATRPAG